MQLMRWFVLFLVVMVAPAAAQVLLQADVGFGGVYRQGAWTPLYITITDPRTESATLEIAAPHGRIVGMRVRQSITIGPTPTSFEVFVPLAESVGGTHISVLTGKGKPTSLDIADYQTQFNAAVPTTPADNGNVVVALSGRDSSAAMMQSEMSMPACKAGYAPEGNLPMSAIGYDGVDALILDSPTWSEINPDSEMAIVDWVRAGGNLILWPGQGAQPAADDVLAAALPAQIGLPRAFDVSAEDRQASGLGDRYATMTGHDLQPRPGALPISIFGEVTGQPGSFIPGPDSIVGYRKRVGLGNIVISPVDLGLVQFRDSEKRTVFWTSMIQEVMPDATARLATQNSQYTVALNQTYINAVSAAMDKTGNVPGLGRFDFSYIAFFLIGLMIIVGPVDWFVLRKLGMQPWTWVTTAGWIVLVTVGAIEAGYWLKSGDLYFNTLRVVDEVDDHDAYQVASRGVVAIYSPQTKRYDIEPSSGGWWEPLSTDVYLGGSQATEDLDFVQHRDSTVPDNMLVRVWNIRFLRSESVQREAPMLQSHLSVDSNNKLRGSIINLGTTLMKDVTVRGQVWTWNIGDLPPGANNINAGAASGVAPAGQPGELAHPPFMGQPRTQDGYDALGDLADRRSRQIDAAITEGHRVCVYARVENPAALATQQVPGALMSNWEIIRSLVTLEPEATTSAP